MLERKTNLVLYFVSQSYIKVSNAGSKPSSDFEVTLNKLGFKGLGLKSVYTTDAYYWWIRNWLSAQLAKILMVKGKTVVFQYPEQRHLKSLLSVARRKRNKVIMLVHDINELRGFPNNHPELLRQADVVIAHSPAMQRWLKENYGIEKSISLGLFDYLSHEIPSVEVNLGQRPSIVFAGRLDKSGFISGLCKSCSNIDFVLFGPGIKEEIKKEKNIYYKGVCSPEELPKCISKYNFGLVWDGESIEGCEGATGNYVKYNSPYKISSYLVAGLPVIVWRQMAVADFVEDNNIGLVVDNLTQLQDIINCLSVDEYLKIKDNVKKIRNRLINGNFYEDAIYKALEMI